MKKIFNLLTIAVLLMAVLTNCNKDVAVTGVKLDKNSLTLGVGETKTLFATVLPENATNKLVTWVSSNINVATVTSSGQVTAHSIGETKIEVRTVDGAFTAVCKLNVSVLQPTNEELITQEKGWILYTATSIPAYESYGGIVSENLFISFFYECELDDIMYYKKNKSQILNFGKMLCEGDEEKEIYLGNWRFLQGETALEFYLPYFFDADGTFYKLEGKIAVLDENTLQIRLPLMFDDGTKMAKRVLAQKDTKAVKEYEFTLTYKKY